jgi:hypothetical protein
MKGFKDLSRVKARIESIIEHANLEFSDLFSVLFFIICQNNPLGADHLEDITLETIKRFNYLTNLFENGIKGE